MDRPQRLARRQEKGAARSYGGRAVPRSGSGDLKGDVETDTELIECKHTERMSFSLRASELFKHATNAIVARKRMVFEIEFTRPDGSLPWRFVVLNKDEYIEMRDELERLRSAHEECAN